MKLVIRIGKKEFNTNSKRLKMGKEQYKGYIYGLTAMLVDPYFESKNVEVEVK